MMKLLPLLVLALVTGNPTAVSSPVTLLRSLSEDKTTEHHTAIEYNVVVNKQLVLLQNEPAVRKVECKYHDTDQGTKIDLIFTVSDAKVVEKWGKHTILNGGVEWGCKFNGQVNVILAKVETVSSPMAISPNLFSVTVRGSVASFTDAFDEAALNIHSVSVPHDARAKHTLSLPEGADFKTVSAHLDRIERRAKLTQRGNPIQLNTPVVQAKAAPQVVRAKVEPQQQVVAPEIQYPRRSLLQTCSVSADVKTFSHGTGIKYTCNSTGTFRVNYTVYTLNTNADDFSTYLTSDANCATDLSSNDNPLAVNPNFNFVTSGSCSTTQADCVKSTPVTPANNPSVVCLFVACNNNFFSCKMRTTIQFYPEASCPADKFGCAIGQCINSTLHCDGANDCGDYSDEDARCTGTIVVPGAGTTWTPGDFVSITWNSAFAPSATVLVELWNQNIGPDIRLTTLAAAVPNTGSYNFSFVAFSGFAARNDAYVRLTFTTAMGLNRFIESAPFNLADSTATITVTYPNATTLIKGSQALITWTTNGLPTTELLDIRLKNYNSYYPDFDCGSVLPGAMTVNNSGSFLWLVPTAIGTAFTSDLDWYLEIISTSTGRKGTSARFAIQANVTGNMVITYPRNFDSFKPGDSINITWQLNDVSSSELLTVSLQEDLAYDIDNNKLIALSPSGPFVTELDNVPNTGFLQIYLPNNASAGGINGMYIKIEYSLASGLICPDYCSPESARFMVPVDEPFSWNYNVTTGGASAPVHILDLNCNNLGFAGACPPIPEVTPANVSAKLACFLCEQGRDVHFTVDCDNCWMTAVSAVTKFEWHKTSTSPLDYLLLTVSGDLLVELNLLTQIRLQRQDAFRTQLLQVPVPIAGIPFTVAGVALSFGLNLRFDASLAYDLDANGTLTAGGTAKMNFTAGMTKNAQSENKFQDVDFTWLQTHAPAFKVAAKLNVELGLIPLPSFYFGPARDLLALEATVYLLFKNNFQSPPFPAYAQPYNPPEGTSLIHAGACNTPHYIDYAVLVGLKGVMLSLGIDLTGVLDYQKVWPVATLAPKGPYPVLSGCLWNESQAVTFLDMIFFQNPYSSNTSEAKRRAFSSLLASDLGDALAVRPSRFFINYTTVLEIGGLTHALVALLPPETAEEASVSLFARMNLQLLFPNTTFVVSGKVGQYLWFPGPTGSPTKVPTGVPTDAPTPRGPSPPSPRTLSGAAEVSASFGVVLFLLLL